LRVRIYPVDKSLCYWLVFTLTVDEQTRSTPVKVIRHVNGPSAWILPSVDDPLSVVKPPEPVKTHGEPSRDDPTSDTTWHRSEERNLAGKQVSEVKVWHVADEAHGQDTYERRKVASFRLRLTVYMRHAQGKQPFARIWKC